MRGAQEDESGQHEPSASSQHHLNSHPQHHPSESMSSDEEQEGENHLSSSAEQQQQQQPRNATQDALKKVRVAKAQAEIDRILSGPDPPLDMEAELEKVVSMSMTPSEQPLLDAEMAQLESELYQAVKQQDFSLASAKKTQLGQLQQDQCVVDDGGAILQVNAAFYRAFSHKSWEEMERVWLRHDDPASCVCIHPSHKPLVGARRISKSWKQMFASTDGSFQRNWMEPQQISVMMKGGHMAIVTCEEHVFARRFVRGQKRQTELINKLLATNIFRKVADKWYMCYHHASWHPDSDAAKRALTGGSGSRIVSSANDGPNSSLAASLAARRRRRRRQLEDDEDDEMEETIGMDGILGNDFGPILGEGSKEGGNNGEGKPKRIIMGASLSDLLNGGLGDLLGGSGEGSAGSNNNNGLGNNIPQEGAIIQFSRINEEDDDEEDDDDDDDEELDLHHLEIVDDDDEDDNNNEGESVAIIKEWAKSSSKRKDESDAPRAEKTSAGESVSESKQAGKGLIKDALRQNCISALRKLCDQGSISPKQKRVLLTDIITCSSKGDFSMVEVAYELLCGEGDDDEEDTAEEEFAEQCRVFAQEHLQKQEKEI